jgi:hypothetical protein
VTQPSSSLRSQWLFPRRSSARTREGLSAVEPALPSNASRRKVLERVKCGCRLLDTATQGKGKMWLRGHVQRLAWRHSHGCPVRGDGKCSRGGITAASRASARTPYTCVHSRNRKGTAAGSRVTACVSGVPAGGIVQRRKRKPRVELRRERWRIASGSFRCRRWRAALTRPPIPGAPWTRAVRRGMV